jgi:hypothetical protein
MLTFATGSAWVKNLKYKLVRSKHDPSLFLAHTHQYLWQHCYSPIEFSKIRKFQFYQLVLICFMTQIYPIGSIHIKIYSNFATSKFFLNPGNHRQTQPLLIAIIAVK